MKSIFITILILFACTSLQAKTCVGAVCALPNNWCGDQSNIKTITGLCANSDGDCVDTICARNPNNCDSSSELQSVILACKIQSGGNCNEVETCLSAVCKQHPNMCDDAFDLTQTKNACSRANGDYIAAVCEFSAKTYDSSLNSLKVINACKSRMRKAKKN